MADFGADISLDGDLDPYFTIVRGETALIQALLRRLRGTLFYDPSYGLPVLQYLEDSQDLSTLARIESAIEAEMLKDERVVVAAVSASYNLQTETLSAEIDIVPSDNDPFTFVVSIDDATVELLDGQAPNVVTTTTAAIDESATVNIVQGPEGPRGPAGAPGPTGSPGGGGAADRVIDASETLVTSGSTEDVLWEWVVNLDEFTGTIIAALVASAQAVTSTGTIRLRVGGSAGVADGTVLGTATVTAGAQVSTSASGSFASGGGSARLKITGQSGAGGTLSVIAPTVVLRQSS